MFCTDKHSDALLRLSATVAGETALPEVVTVFNPTGDPDGDGQTTGSEFAAGTHPRDGASVFRISSVQVEAGVMAIEFPSVTGKNYRVMISETLMADSWEILQEGIVGTGATIPITAPARRFASPPFLSGGSRALRQRCPGIHGGGTVVCSRWPRRSIHPALALSLFAIQIPQCSARPDNRSG